MAGLKEQAIWENNIYQIEENDPVHGGEDGITNKPTKQLANRTLYLRNLLTLAGQKIVPKTITATSSNNADATGHTHEIAHGTTGQKGIVQLTNDTGLDSESLALTAKAGKAIAQSVAQLQLSTTNALNQKVNKTDISNSVNSTSQTTVASSQAVKTAYDLASSKYTAQDANPTQKGLVQLADNLTTDDSNKALSAKQGKALKDEIDGIEIGGRNYLRNSANFNHITSNNQSIVQITKTVENGINVLTSTVVDSGSATFGKHYLSTYSVTLDNLTVLTDNLINQQLTVSVDVKSNVNTKIRLGYSNYQGAEFDLVAGQWQRIHYSFDSAQGLKRVPVLYNTRGEQEGGTVKIYHKNWMIEKGNRPSDWTPAPEDAEDYNRQNYVAKSGDTMTGPLNINHATSYLRGKNNGADDWFVGRVRNNDNDIALASYQNSTGVHLKADRVESSKPLYRGANQVFDEGNLQPVRHINLRSHIPGTQIEYQNATPSELPLGSYTGFTTNSQLSGSGVFSGWGFVTKIDNTQAFRQAVNFDRFFAQWGNTTNGWGGVYEYFMLRPQLWESDLNNVTACGVYAQIHNANALPTRNYPVQEAGTLLVTPSAYGYQQEYTTFFSNQKFVRGRNDDGWLSWKRIDALDSVSKAGDTMTGDLRLQQKIILDSMLMQFGGDDFIHKDNSGTALHGYHFVEDSIGDPRRRGNATLWANDFVAGNDKRLSDAMMAGDVAVLTGEIAHGGTLPIPSGFTESQCRFFVSMKHSNPNRMGWDWNENAGGRHYRTQCYASGRTVTCQTFVSEGIWGHGAIPLTIDGIANYLVIGVK